METREILITANYVIETYRERVLPLLKEGDKDSFQEVVGHLDCMGRALEGLNTAIMVVIFNEFFRLQIACQALKLDCQVEHFKIVVEPIISQLEELSKSLSQDSD